MLPIARFPLESLATPYTATRAALLMRESNAPRPAVPLSSQRTQLKW